MSLAQICGTDEGVRSTKASSCQQHYQHQDRLINSSYSIRGWKVCFSLCALQLLCLFAIELTQAARTSKPWLYEEFIEGRLDTSQLCGTRYAGDFRQKQHQNNNLLYIVGGDQVEDDQFWPWSVAIYELDPLNGHKAFICSGSLISDKFILTAAHCIQQSRFDILSANEVFLKIASVRLDDASSRFYQVESVFVHPEYRVDRQANDIALLRLMTGQRLPSRARPICLPSHVANRIDFTDQQVTIIGWGKTSAVQGNEPTRLIDAATASSSATAEISPTSDSLNDDDTETNVIDNVSANTQDHNSKSSSSPQKATTTSTADDKSADDSQTNQTNDTLLQAEVRVTSTDQCNRNYSRLEVSWLNIDEHFLCASDPQGKRDACQGDSGGPLMWNNQQGLLEHITSEKWYQLGLVSFGHGCANSQYPGVYTRISYYIPWILNIVNNGRGATTGISAQSVPAAGKHTSYNWILG